MIKNQHILRQLILIKIKATATKITVHVTKSHTLRGTLGDTEGHHGRELN